MLHQNLDDQPAPLEEGKQNEFERLFHISHEELQILDFILPGLRLGQLPIHLL